MGIAERHAVCRLELEQVCTFTSLVHNEALFKDIGHYDFLINTDNHLCVIRIKFGNNLWCINIKKG